MRTKRWLAPLAALLALAACGRQPFQSAPAPGGGTLQGPAPAPGVGTLKIRTIYDYVGDREGTPWEPFELNGEYNWPERIFGGWPMRVIPVDAAGNPTGPAVETATLRELSPTDGRYLTLPAGRYKVEEVQPSNRGVILGGPGFWTNTGANVTQGGVTTQSGPGTSTLFVEVVAGTDHATATVARFFEVCQTAFGTPEDRVDIEPQFAGADAEDIRTTNTNCTPRFASRRLQPNRQIASGVFHSLAIRADGTVVAWGRPPEGDDRGQVNVPPGLSDVIAVSAGYYHNLALKAYGTAVAWGELGVPPGLSGVVAIAAGYGHDVYLKSDGTVVGLGGAPVPAGLTDVVAIATGHQGGYHLAVKADGTVVGWGVANSGQTDVPPGLVALVP